jgi:hypothetical protein
VTDTSPYEGEALPTVSTTIENSTLSLSPPPSASLSYGPWSPTRSHEERGRPLRSLAALARGAA